jgi:hypothetical protein
MPDFLGLSRIPLRSPYQQMLAGAELFGANSGANSYTL